MLSSENEKLSYIGRWSLEDSIGSLGKIIRELMGVKAKTIYNNFLYVITKVSKLMLFTCSHMDCRINVLLTRMS